MTRTFLAQSEDQRRARLQQLTGVRQSPRLDAAVAILGSIALLPSVRRRDIFSPRAGVGDRFPARTVDRGISLLRDAGCLAPIADDERRVAHQEYRVVLAPLTGDANRP